MSEQGPPQPPEARGQAEAAVGGQHRPTASRHRRRREPKGQVETGAGFWIRALARIIDLFCHYALVAAGFFGACIVTGILMAMGRAAEPDPDRLAEASLVRIVAAVIAYVGYHVIAEGFGGATPGKLICGLRVISQEKGPCRFVPALLRNIYYFVDGLFLGVIAYVSMHDSKLSQRYGDKWAKTMVVKSGHAPPDAKRSGIGVALALIVAVAFSTALSFASSLIRLLGQ